MRFSQRQGLVEARVALQKEAIDRPLRNKLWDIVQIYLDRDGSTIQSSPMYDNYVAIWTDFFEMARDEVPHEAWDANPFLRKWFYAAEWYEVYDLVEFLVQECSVPQLDTEALVRHINGELERYLSAYRFVGSQITPIIDEQEIVAVETALSGPLPGVTSHLSKSLAHLSNRSNPDIPNSIKESISAVESICSALVGKRATLGEALKKLEGAGFELHPALEKAWLSLYGYTSDAQGIRHAMQDDPTTSIDDAVYFLVSCSAFVNLLTSKAVSQGITLNPLLPKGSA